GNDYELPANGFTAPENKVFSHWKIGNEDKNPDDKITVNGDTEVKAIWKDIKVKVSYSPNGGIGTMEGKELVKGSTYKLLANGFTAPENKEFDRWEVNGEKLSPNSEITLDKDTIITAIWKNKTPETPPVTEKVKVIYYSNGGRGSMEGKELNKGSKYTLLANGFTAPDKKKFKGWKIGDTEYAAGAEITVDKDTTVIAVWEDIETTPPVKEEVQVSYEPGEGSGTMDGAKLEKGSKYILSANGFKAPDKKKFKGWKIGDTEYVAGDEITVYKDITVTAVWENVKIDPGKPGDGGNPDNPGTNPDQGGDNPNPGTTPGEGDNPNNPGTKPGEGDNPDNPGTNPDQAGDKPNPGTNPDQGGDNPKPGTTPDQGGDKPNPEPKPEKPGEVGDSGNPDKKPDDCKDQPNPGHNPGKDSESPRPGTKPNDGENKAKSTGKDTSKKTEGNKENPLDNSKVRVPRTKEVKENVQTGVEPIGQIGGILSAAIAGLFASKKRKK
ncbi:InlB B-repeat-containing protein, partial [Anaerococcus sp.]|uniref:InlB B-repeat-containing protein n=1 Tax=Anaerococcus sp. TaxID=1872515 RepID=UPI002A75E901